MGKRIRDYLKYTKIELENYTKLPGACIQKINKNMHINFPPYGLGSMKSTLLNIISEKKVGSYDHELEGIILDVRNIKALGNLAALRFDDPTLHIDIKADCYVFNPKIGSIVRGLVKHIAAHQISVIIYRVFNVSIRLSSAECYNSTIELNSEIEFRIKNFDLRSLMPYIEGELVCKEMPLKHIYLNISDSDSNSIDSEEQNEKKPLTEITDDEEIIFSEIFQLKSEEVENENGTIIVNNENEHIKIGFSESVRSQELDEIENTDNNVYKDSDNKNIYKKETDSLKSYKKTPGKEKTKIQSLSSTEDSDRDLVTSIKSNNLQNHKFLPYTKSGNSTVTSQTSTEKKSIKLENSSSTDNEIGFENLTAHTKNSEIKRKSLTPHSLKIMNKISDNSENTNSEEEIAFKNNTSGKKNRESLTKKTIQSEKYKKKLFNPVVSSSEGENQFENITPERRNSKNKKESSTELKEIKIKDNHHFSVSSNRSQNITYNKNIETSNSDSEIEFKNVLSSTINSKFLKHKEIKLPYTETKNNIGKKSTNKTSNNVEPTKIKLENIVSHIGKDYENEDIYGGILISESQLGLQQSIENNCNEAEKESSKKRKSNIKNSSNQILNETVEDKVNKDSAIITIETETTPTAKKRKRTLSEEYLTDIINTFKTKNQSSNKTPITNTIVNNDVCIPKKTNSLTASMADIMSRVLSRKTESSRKKTDSESSLVNEENDKAKSSKNLISESNAIRNNMANIMERVLSQKIETALKKTTSESSSDSVSSNMHNSPKKLISFETNSLAGLMAGNKAKKSKKSTSSESNSLTGSMADIMAQVLSKKTEESSAIKVKKSTSSESNSLTSLMTDNNAKKSKKSSSSDSNSLTGSMAAIMSQILSKKTEEQKKKIVAKSLVNEKKSKDKSSKKNE